MCVWMCRVGMVVEESQPANWKAASTPEQLRERLKQGECVRERECVGVCVCVRERE